MTGSCWARSQVPSFDAEDFEAECQASKKLGLGCTPTLRPPSSGVEDGGRRIERRGRTSEVQGVTLLKSQHLRKTSGAAEPHRERGRDEELDTRPSETPRVV